MEDKVVGIVYYGINKEFVFNDIGEQMIRIMTFDEAQYASARLAFLDNKEKGYYEFERIIVADGITYHEYLDQRLND